MEQVDTSVHFSPSRIKAVHLLRQKYQWKGALNGVFVSVLVLFGIIGVLTILYFQAARAAKQVEQKVALTANRQLPQPMIAAAAIMVTSEEDKVPFVYIEGELKRDNNLSVIIDSFDPKADYILDMGNGQKLKMDKRELVINYSMPGIYYPIMEVSFKGEFEKVALDKLWIR